MSAQQIYGDVSSRGGVRHVRKICRIIDRPPKLGALLVWFLCFSLSILILPAVLQANPDDAKEGTATSPGIKAFYLTASPVFQLGSNINGGGSLSVNSLYTSGGFQYQINEKFGMGLGLYYNASSYRFSGVTAIPLPDPWDTVLNYGGGIPFTFALTKQWQIIIVPSVQFAGETGANWGSSLVYGGIGSVTYNWGKANYIGLGVAGFQNLGETDIFPYINVNWHITDRWRLSNPLESSPNGPGGLKLSYGLTPHWEIGAAGAYRFYRFRLDRNGSLPNGIGQYSQLPLVGNLTYTKSLVSLTVYGGVALKNKIWLETSNYDGIYQAGQKPAPLVGFNVTIGMEPSQFRAQPWQIRQFASFL